MIGSSCGGFRLVAGEQCEVRVVRALVGPDHLAGRGEPGQFPGAGGERAGGPDGCAFALAPPPVSGVEAGLFGAQAGAEDTASVEEQACVVLGFGVGGGGEADAFGAGEVPVAGEVAPGAFDEPAQDAGAFFGDEDAGQFVDLADVGDDALEQDQTYAAP